MNLRFTAFGLVCFLILTLVTTPSWGVSTWCGSPQATPGSPWSLQILSSDVSGTRLSLDCPGFWLQTIEQAGEVRSHVQLPQAGVTTTTDLPELPAIGKLLALPGDRGVEIIVHQVTLQTFPCSNPYLAEPIEGAAIQPNSAAASTEAFPVNWAQTFVPGILKDHRIVPVNLYPIRYDFVTHELLLATHLEIEIRTTSPSSENVKTFYSRSSEAFSPVYQANLANLDVYNVATPLSSEGPRGKYMIFIHQDYQTNDYLDSLVTWKRQLGYQVVLKAYPSGYTKEQILADLQTEYYQGDTPLDYVLLIGDVTGNMILPAHTIVRPGGGEIDPTDHPYALLEGDDYFPDVMIGRLSVNSSYLSSALSKILHYQKNPYMTNPTWFKSALVVAGNFSDQLPIPITPAWTSLWLADKLIEYGYTDVDTVIYWGPGFPIPSTSLISGPINNPGVGLVAYRGWASASGWQYPVFTTTNIEQLQNGRKLPIVASIVCETGNFSDPTDPCFGEAWIRYGTASNPKGGAAFYGPSDLHTNTKWNNALYAGFFEGLLEENLYRIGQSVLRSKMELYYGFPENTAVGDFTHFYFHTYNLLGDPELSIWTDTPILLHIEAPAQIQPGRQFITVRATRATNGSPLSGAYVAFYKANEVLTGAITSGDGYVSAEIEPITAGEVVVTVSKQNCKSYQVLIPVAIGAFPLGINGLSLTGVAQAGETFDLNLNVFNFGADPIANIQAILSEADPYVTIADSSAAIVTLNGGAGILVPYSVTLTNAAPDQHVVDFTLSLFDAQDTTQAKFILPVGGFQFLPIGLDTITGSLNPGGTAQVKVLLCNIGALASAGLIGTLSCNSAAVTITQNQSSFPLLQPNVTLPSNTTYTIQVSPAVANGSQVIFNLALSEGSGGFTQTVSLPVQLGQSESTDPLGPDSYGYYAYDNTDDGYAKTPVYSWIELDPQAGSTTFPGVPFFLADDQSKTILLPFTFRYYGQDYDSLSICSNGYVSFHDTWMAEFRNWNIPSALGPPTIVAPFWDDLKADTTGGEDSLRIFQYEDQSGGRFIVEWSRTINRYGYEVYSNWKKETFELVLFDPVQHPTASGDGDLLFQYYEVYDVDDNNNFSTVGMEDEGHVRGLQYAYSKTYPTTAALLQAGRAILITTDRPDTFTVNQPPGGNANRIRFDAPQPNPANPGSVLHFFLPRSGQTHIELYNTLGQHVASLLNRDLSPGLHRLEVNGESWPSGLYFVVLRFVGETVTQKLLILK